MADVGFGTSISFSSSFLAEVLSVSGGHTRASIDTTHMTTSAGKMTFMPSDLTDAGELTVELLMNPNAGSSGPPITGAAETVTITFPTPSGGSGGATMACSGFLTSFTFNVPHDDRMTATATIKLSGAATWTDST